MFPLGDVEHVDISSIEDLNKENHPSLQLTRRRKSNPAIWSRKCRKDLRNSGLSYISTSKKLVPAKSPKELCSCKYKCGTKFSQVERQEICAAY